MSQTDVIIIGSGVAALSAAYYLRHKRVKIITKSSWVESNSMLAQGGIAAAVHKADSWISHFEDTLVAGCDHNHVKNVKYLVENAPDEISEWCQRGMLFDCDQEGGFLLGKEGAHSKRRILHAGGDATGKKLTEFLFQLIKHSATIIENEMVVDLIIEHGSCKGVITKNNLGFVQSYFANHTIIASGGCGAVYGHTSNADVITGDGIAMAYRAGAEIADMEFVQFHPTMLHVNGRCVGLISEAVRGEGARLVNDSEEAFMKNVHVQAELAPRDVVSRAIFDQLKQGKGVFLDISSISNFTRRFPTITQLCKRYGVDVDNGRIPVAPGMHFLMGGIRTNDKGETNIRNLYAVGEAACTGVHGANRLASNSLLEGMVFGKRVAVHLISSQGDKQKSKAEKNHIQPIYQQKQYIDLPTKSQIQNVMTKYVGIIRTEGELRYAVNWFENYKQQLSFKELNVKVFTISELEIANMIIIGWLISSSALKRTESRGAHYRLDYPERNNREWRNKQLIRTNEDLFIGV